MNPISSYQLCRHFDRPVKEGPPPVKLFRKDLPRGSAGATTPPSGESSMTALPLPSKNMEARLKRWWVKQCIRLKRLPVGTVTTISVVRALQNFVRRVFGLRQSGEARHRLRWHWLCFLRLCRALGDCIESPSEIGARVHAPSCACQVCRMHLDSFDVFLDHTQPCLCKHCQWVQIHVSYMEVLR